jgi:rhamnogalacturonan endolyase
MLHGEPIREIPIGCLATGSVRWRGTSNIARAAIVSAAVLCAALWPPAGVQAAKPAERLGRGLIVFWMDEGKAFVSWRMLADDPENVAFNVYRATRSEIERDGKLEEQWVGVQLNREPLTRATSFVDNSFDAGRTHRYTVQAVTGNGVEPPESPPFLVPAGRSARQYLSVPLQTLDGHTPNDASVGDLDGDGEYEIVLKQEMRPRDNSQRGTTGETKLEAYRLDGNLMWRINLGRNIREGAHYTPFLVFDFDDDGRAEVACRTADGTVDGKGKVIGDASADHRNHDGYVLAGPEFLTIFDGVSGAALATADYVPPRGRVADWGDDYGNRVDRFLAAVAYLDGERPSLVMCRGYYTRSVLAAWNWRGGKLERVWTFDSDDGSPGNRAYRGQGNHGLSVGDVDADGRDEIVYGSCVVDDNGKGLYSTGLGHGDALHLADIDPARPGMEVFGIHERARHDHGVELHDARTGKILWSKPSIDVARGVAMDIDPRHRGYESWASGNGLRGLWNAQGEMISQRKPRSCNFGIWWDGDLSRELLDRTTIAKWNWNEESETTLITDRECAANNGSKATPCLCADILGDWREEVIWWTRDGKHLRIYSTMIPTEHRMPTLMHDRQYRLSVAWQNAGYNQPGQLGFWLGEELPRSEK